MRLVFLAVASLLIFGSQRALAAPPFAEAVELQAAEVDLNPREPEDQRLGRLRYLGGLVLSSSDGRFSGISGLRFSGDGDELIGVSDRGHWISFEIATQGERLTGAANAHVWPLLDETGAPIGEPAYDAESFEIIGDYAYVGFERVHRIFRYALGSDENPWAEEFRSVSAFGQRVNNESLEGLTHLGDGRLLAAAEAINDDGTFDAWIMSETDSRTDSLALLAMQPFKLTDLAALPNGDVLTLERRFSPLGGMGARLRLIPADRIGPSMLADGQELANWGSRYTVDNMEGLAVRERDGRTELYLISDDNQNPFQRTILLAFELMYD